MTNLRWTLLAPLMIVAACGKSGGDGGGGGGGGAAKSGDITIKLAGADSAATMKAGGIDSSSVDDQGKKWGSHLVVLTSFDLTEPVKDLGPPLTAPDQSKISFIIMIPGDDSGNTDLKPGRYGKTIPLAGPQLSTFRVFTFDGVEKQWARMGGVVGATVTLTSVTGDAVAGELNLVDGADKVTGTFNVKLKK